MPLSNLGLLLGDPNGIGPELCAKLLSDLPQWESIRVVLLGDPELLETGKKIAGVSLNVPLVN